MSDVQAPRGPGEPPPYPYYQPPPPTSRPVSFYVAIFLALLLVVSVGLNLLLLLVSAVGSFTGGLSVASEDDGNYHVVTVGGDREARPRILRVRIQGAISEVSSPLLGTSGGVVSSVARALRLAGRDDSIRAVLLDIDSPGGGVTDSDEIHRLIAEFRRQHDKKPVLALLGDLAASGGYYVAVACNHVMARPTTVTGSIGVIMQSWNAAAALAKLGIEQVTITSERTPYKDLLSPTKPVDQKDLALLRTIVDEMFDRFVQVVDDGRPNMSREQVLRVATGALFSAEQARQHGLIDSIGSEDDALEMLMSYEAVGKAQLVELQRVPTLFDALFSVRGGRPTPESSAAELLRGMTGPRLLYYWTGGR